MALMVLAAIALWSARGSAGILRRMAVAGLIELDLIV